MIIDCKTMLVEPAVMVIVVVVVVAVKIAMVVVVEVKPAGRVGGEEFMAPLSHPPLELEYDMRLHAEEFTLAENGYADIHL